jgi:hypothetical protein
MPLTSRFIALGVALVAVVAAVRADHDAGECCHCQCGGPCQCACGGYCTAEFIPECYPDAFGFALRGGWLEEWPHSHFSRLGTPMIHFFFTEPAGPERDLIVDYLYTKGPDGKEHEFATELEWAFTRRIGVVLEVPGMVLNPNDGPQEIGFGDFVVAPRFLLADFDRFMLSANLEISTPTGDDERGLGAGETLLAPSLTGWLDLGNWWTAGFQVGSEAGLSSGDNEIFYSVALARTVFGRAVCCPRYSRHGEHGDGEHSDHGDQHGEHDEHDEGNHFPPGLTSWILEFTGRSGTWGPNNGRSTAELLLGVSYTITEHTQVRAGYQFPLGSPRDLDGRAILGAIYHF